MRTFGRIETSIWQNWKFHELSDDEKILWVYLISQPGGKASVKDAALALRWNIERITLSSNALHMRSIATVVDSDIVLTECFKSRPPGRRHDGRIPWYIWTIIRDEIFRRDGAVCRYCDTTDGPFEVDHITPLARGGDDDPSNLGVACRHCNRSKRDRLNWAAG